MNFLRNILFLALTVFTFVGSIGVGVFSHFCSKDGLEQSYFVRQSHHCDEKEAVSPVCCQRHEPKEVLKNNCCSDQMQFVQLNLDYFQQTVAIAFHTFASPSPVYGLMISATNSVSISKSNLANPPPKKNGREIVIHYQEFLI